MKLLPTAVLAVGLLTTGCSPAVDSALGQRPTSYPAAGGPQAAAMRPEGSVEQRLVEQATTAVEAALTYDHEHYAADTAAAQALMTPAFSAAWADVSERLRPTTGERKARVTAQVVDAGVSGATSTRAQVLLFVDRTIRTSDGTQDSAGFAVATMAHRKDGWQLAGLGLTPPAKPIEEQRPVPATVLAAGAALADAWGDLDAAHPRADVARVLELATGPFRRDYEATSGELVARTLASRARQQGRVLAVGLGSLSDDRARVLAAVETVLELPASPARRRLLRLEIVLVRTPGAWLAREVRIVPGS